MDFFNGIGKKISQTGQNVIQKTKDTAEVIKLNALISDEEKKTNNIYLQIGQQYTPNQGMPVPVGQENPTSMPMKWFKCLIYFWLFASAFVYFISAMELFTGLVYGGYSRAEVVYIVFPQLRFVNYVYGILILGLATFSIVTRSKLAGFKKSAIMYLYINYVSNGAISLIYIIATMACINGRLGSKVESQFVTTAIWGVIWSAVMVIINYLYFKKRKFMFIN